MKIIIDITDNIYDAIKSAQTIVSGQRSGKTLFQILVSSVENGTPLPKNHGRLIDADELKTSFPCGESVRTECVRATIDYASTIIEADNEEEQ